MTHRERMLAAISHKQPDVVPTDLGGSKNSSIVVEAYDKLKNFFGIQAEDRLCDRMMRVVNVDERILQRLKISTRGVFPGAPTRGAAREMGPDRYRDMWGVERIHPAGSYYSDQVNYPLSGERNISDILKYPWPDPDDPGFVQGLRERVQWIRKNTDCAVVLTLPAPFIHATQYLRGFEDWYCDFVTNSSFMETLFDAVLEINLQIARNELMEVGKDVDITVCGDDLGTQTGLQISRDDYVRYIKPRHEKFFRQIHDMSPAKVAFHCCGSIAELIDDFIEIGVDVLNPIQPSAENMRPADLKKKYKGRMAFWGAIDCQKVLPWESAEYVKQEVEKCIESLGEDGGYVLSSSHNIQPDVPVENIVAMFDHAAEYLPPYQK